MYVFSFTKTVTFFNSTDACSCSPLFISLSSDKNNISCEPKKSKRAWTLKIVPQLNYCFPVPAESLYWHCHKLQYNSSYFFYLALAVYESPAEVVYSLTGSNITLSWIVRKTYQNFAPTVIIYAKEPSTISRRERTLVSFEGNDVKIFPDGSKQSIKFSPNQLELVTSDATLPGITEELIKYSLVIRNLSDNQENTYMFQANYRVDLAGPDVGTRLIVTGMWKLWWRMFNVLWLIIINITFLL